MNKRHILMVYDKSDNLPSGFTPKPPEGGLNTRKAGLFKPPSGGLGVSCVKFAVHPILVYAVLLLATLTSSAQKMILSAAWRDSAITVDGNPMDWDQPFRYFDSKSKLQYSVVNDKHDLYICIKTIDDKAQMKILRAGMDVTVDVSGKKKEGCTLFFPLQTDPKLDMNADPDNPDQQKIERPDVKKLKLDMATASQTIRASGFKTIPNSFQQGDSSKYGIQVAVNWDKNDALTYELKVPFKLFYKEELQAADTLKPITIVVRVNGMILPLISNTPANADATGTAGGMNGTGMNGTGMGGPGNGMNGSARPGTPVTQPSLAIPQSAADMGQNLQVAMKMKLAYRE